MARMREAASIPGPSAVPRLPHLPAAAGGWGPEEGPFDLRLLLIAPGLQERRRLMGCGRQLLAKCHQSFALKTRWLRFNSPK